MENALGPTQDLLILIPCTTYYVIRTVTPRNIYTNHSHVCLIYAHSSILMNYKRHVRVPNKNRAGGGSPRNQGTKATHKRHPLRKRADRYVKWTSQLIKAAITSDITPTSIAMPSYLQWITLFVNLASILIHSLKAACPPSQKGGRWWSCLPKSGTTYGQYLRRSTRLGYKCEGLGNSWILIVVRERWEGWWDRRDPGGSVWNLGMWVLCCGGGCGLYAWLGSDWERVGHGVMIRMRE